MPPILSFKIISKSVPHSLRALSVITFPPAFLFLLITGIASSRVNPAICILPLFFSSLWSLFLLANERTCGCAASGLTGTPMHLLVDLALGIWLLVCLIVTWVVFPQRWWHDYVGLVMLGSYGTVFVMWNFAVHLYFVAGQVYEALAPGAGAQYPSACAQCRYGPFPLRIRIETRSPVVAEGGYAPLLDGRKGSVEQERRDVGDEVV